jgi:hypothetical protein
MYKKFGKPKIKKEFYRDDKIYEGELLNRKRHGKGKMTYPDGSSFEGEWEYGKLIGKCKMTLTNCHKL